MAEVSQYLVKGMLSHVTTACFSGIRLAGATSDVHIMDVRTGKWEKMVPHGEPPSPRAAHAAAAVGSMVVVQVRLEIISAHSHTVVLSTAEACLTPLTFVCYCREASGQLV